MGLNGLQLGYQWLLGEVDGDRWTGGCDDCGRLSGIPSVFFGLFEVILEAGICGGHAG